ncbi:hypothetical protein GCM10010383_25920 [Streptomyces lomondensis]|uniref:Transposase n=1 Tax=Streptomyces lomondensis TaxID=68229 RepID=A0ABQ2X2P5_9ACTN|nr:hypothetical protein GCM10010383_25920 [Streptomyces lomondensis]
MRDPVAEAAAVAPAICRRRRLLTEEDILHPFRDGRAMAWSLVRWGTCPAVGWDLSGVGWLRALIAAHGVKRLRRARSQGGEAMGPAYGVVIR